MEKTIEDQIINSIVLDCINAQNKIKEGDFVRGKQFLENGIYNAQHLLRKLDENLEKELLQMTDPIQNAMKKIRKLIDEAEADEEKYYQMESPKAQEHCKTMALAYKIALSKLDREELKNE